MRIRGLFFFRRYHIPTFIIVLLLFGLVLMSLRVKQRQGVAFLDALLLEVTKMALLGEEKQFRGPSLGKE